MMLCVKEVENSYQFLFEKMDDDDMEAIIYYLCLSCTNWLEKTNFVEKIVLRMNLRPPSKVWYHFLNILLFSLHIMKRSTWLDIFNSFCHNMPPATLQR